MRLGSPDFGVATRLTRERQSPEPPELIAGTLAHMAPEQTGRMNRSIDSRSDLYSLGVTLYQTLTGDLPFTASDPWNGCTAISHESRCRSKRASHMSLPGLDDHHEAAGEDRGRARYQTAAGVERDLRRCLSEWETRRAIREFPSASTIDRIGC